MKVVEINQDYILFNNGIKIESRPQQSYVEYYADFYQLQDTTVTEVEFPVDIKFQPCWVNDYDIGFRFGTDLIGWYYVPCYSVAEGYYGIDIDIYYNDKKIIKDFTNIDYEG